MILFNLTCSHEHEFEAWFRDGATYEVQAAAGDITCPVCSDRQIRKAPMAPSLVKGAKASSSPQAMAELDAALGKLRKEVEANCIYVGDRFPEEARRIHYGETDERPIFGEASAEEARSLRDEGIEVVAVPWLPQQDS